MDWKWAPDRGERVERGESEDSEDESDKPDREDRDRLRIDWESGFDVFFFFLFLRLKWMSLLFDVLFWLELSFEIVCSCVKLTVLLVLLSILLDSSDSSSSSEKKTLLLFDFLFFVPLFPSSLSVHWLWVNSKSWDFCELVRFCEKLRLEFFDLFLTFHAFFEGSFSELFVFCVCWLFCSWEDPFWKFGLVWFLFDTWNACKIDGSGIDIFR